MKGSEKQVAWATEARNKILDGLEKVSRHADVIAGPHAQAWRDKAEEFRRRLLSQDDSRFWIDHFGRHKGVPDPLERPDLAEAGNRDKFGFATTRDETKEFEVGLKKLMSVINTTLGMVEDS